MIEITKIKNKIIEVEKHISKLPNVCAVYDITRLTDIIIVFKFRDRKELSDFVKNDLSLQYNDRTKYPYSFNYCERRFQDIAVFLKFRHIFRGNCIIIYSYCDDLLCCITMKFVYL